MGDRPRGTLADVIAAVLALPDTGTRLVGIDGPGGAGKTTLAARVAAGVRTGGTDVDVVHVDHFPPSDPGGEWNWDRLRAQLLLPLFEGRPARYQEWDWGAATGGPWHDVAPGGVVVIEGVSSTRREVGAPWALTVWVDTPVALRRTRALERDGGQLWPLWRDVWIPSEEAYIAREHPADRVHLVVDGAA